MDEGGRVRRVPLGTATDTIEMIIDSHAHAWSHWPYEPAVPDPASRGAAEQLLWEMDRAGVDRAVVVSACIDHNPENNDYVAGVVQAHPDRLIQFADVDSRWSPDHHSPGGAERLARIADRTGAAGITHYLGPANDGWLRSDEGAAFFAEAESRGLVMSLAGPPVWQDDLRWLAARVPALPILCHHLAGVPSYTTDRRAGLEMVLPSSEVPNIFIKASGFYYGAAEPYDYPHPEGAAIFRALFAAFGPSRFVWGSDYPVAPMRAYTYRQSLELLRSHCPFIAPEALPPILGSTLEALLRGNGSGAPSTRQE